MNRRSFLRNALVGALGAAAAATIDPELLAWEPGKKKIFDLGQNLAPVACDKLSGISLRLIEQYDIASDKFPCRLDVLMGWAEIRPDYAIRLWNDEPEISIGDKIAAAERRALQPLVVVSLPPPKKAITLRLENKGTDPIVFQPSVYSFPWQPSLPAANTTGASIRIVANNGVWSVIQERS